VAIQAASAESEGRRERRARELRVRIYETARALFLEHGFDATTVNQIAAAADIAPATFFNHFQSKAAILEAMTNEVSEHLETLVSQQLNRPGTTQDRILEFAKAVGEQIRDANNLAHDVLLGLMQVGVRSGEIAPHLAGIFAPFTEMLEDGQAHGYVRTDLDAAFLAEVVVGALNSAITRWLSDPDYALADRLQQTAAFMGEAIAPRTSS
jgi:AcrR family transcriptional regulator